jgi:four helix bundle protein
MNLCLSFHHVPEVTIRLPRLRLDARRASASVALNLAEGSGSAGGTRNSRYRTALGSARETGVWLGKLERVIAARR